MSDYPTFGSIPRLHRDITITEKIDGTNGLVSIERRPLGAGVTIPEGVVLDHSERDIDGLPTHEFHIRAGSRNRWITPESDNHGFARWVADNAGALAALLGEGNHYGEWWGSGIQRGYGLEKGEKRFSLFNTFRWTGADLSAVPGLGVVPLITVNTADNLNATVRHSLDMLHLDGSKAAPGFMRPEGVVVYHHAAKQYFKATLEKDDQPKSLAGAA